MTTYRAALPMYDLPEERAQTDAEWATIQAALPPDLSVRFERPVTWGEMHDLMSDPALLLSQTCWGPIGKGMTPPLTIVAQPDYSPYPGGQGPHYRSAIVVAGSGPDAPVPAMGARTIPAAALRGARLACNEPASMSGSIALLRDAGTVFASTLETGSHRASVAAVADGAADVAAIDCRTLALLRRHDVAARRVQVIGWTAARPGLPLVASPTLPRDLLTRLRAVLFAHGAHPPAARPPRGLS